MTDPPRIGILPGDGIGIEVVGAATRVLKALPLEFDLEQIDAGWSTFERCGTALPEASLAAARDCTALLFGAVSSPSTEVDGYSSPILELRRELDLFANLRPVVSSPLDSSRLDVDMLIVRENTEGLYCGRERLEDDGRIAIAERLISERASRRIAERAFAEAERRAETLARPARVTVVHKANVLRMSDGLFRRTVLDTAKAFPAIEVEEQLVDSMIYRMILEPQRYDVIVAPNLYGDILSDAAAALVGGLGLVPSANVGDRHILVEPVHGSAPDIAGQGRANPIATLRAVVLMLEHLGEGPSASLLTGAIEYCLRHGPRTEDLAGTASTEEVADAILEQVRRPVPAEAAF